MGKLFFIPVSIVGGLLAGLAGRKAFELLWGLVDDQEPPDPEHREISVPKMIAAQALGGAVFGAFRAIADHGARVGFYRATGAWPGEERPEGTEPAS
jgi:hypothetical protein